MITTISAVILPTIMATDKHNSPYPLITNPITEFSLTLNVSIYRSILNSLKNQKPSSSPMIITWKSDPIGRLCIIAVMLQIRSGLLQLGQTPVCTQAHSLPYFKLSIGAAIKRMRSLAAYSSATILFTPATTMMRSAP